MSDLLRKINSLAIFGGLRQREPLNSLCKFLRLTELAGTKLEDVIEAYSEFVRQTYLMSPEADFSSALWDALKEDENVYFKIVANNFIAKKNGEETVKISRLLELQVARELDLLTEIGNTSYIELQKLFYYDGNVAQFNTTGIDMKTRYLTYLSDD